MNLAGLEHIDNLLEKKITRSACFKFSIGGLYQLHLKGTSSEDPNIPDQFENIIESPAIGTFFGNSGNLKFSIEYRIRSESDRTFSFGFEYESTILKNKESGTELFFGEDIKIKSFVPFVCYNKFLNKYIIFGKIGIPYKSYRGEGFIDGYTIINNYKNSLGLRLGAGFDAELSSRLSFSSGIDMDFGMVERKNVAFYLNGRLISKLTAEGDDLEDTQITFYALISYKIILNHAGGNNE